MLNLCLLLIVAQAGPGDLLVTSRNTDEVLRYDANDGHFVGVFAAGGGLDNPVGLTFGPDGHLYVASALTNEVLRYDGVTGAFLDVFASGVGVNDPRNINFGPDGNLYVANAGNNRIQRFDGTTGANLGVAASGGALSGPTSFTIGPDHDFFVVSVLTNHVKRYDGATGAYEGNFIGTNVNRPHDVAFGPDGRVYVTNAQGSRIQAFHPRTGQFLETLVNDPALQFALGLSWDDRGRLYVSNQGRNELRRYDAVTGEFLDTIVLPGAGGLDSPLFHVFMPDRTGLKVAPFWPGYVGESNTLAVSGAVPGSRILLMTGTGTSTISAAGCSNPVTLLAPALQLAALVADESGRAYFAGVIPADLAPFPMSFQALVPFRCDVSPIVQTQLERRIGRAPSLR